MLEINKIYNEDCLEGMKKIDDESIDCIICDLPYGTTKNSWDSVIPLNSLWTEYKRIIKPAGAIVLFAQTPFDKILGASNIEMLKYEWIWEKEAGTGFLNANKMPLKIHENVLVFYRDLPTYNPIMRKGFSPYTHFSKGGKTSTNYGEHHEYITKSNGERFPIDILFFPRDRDGFHPTQKPVDIIRYFISTYTDVGGVILDNCMGSGTTAIACIKEKRHFIGFELNKEYFDKAVKRINAEKSQLLLF